LKTTLKKLFKYEFMGCVITVHSLCSDGSGSRVSFAAVRIGHFSVWMVRPVIQDACFTLVCLDGSLTYPDKPFSTHFFPISLLPQRKYIFSLLRFTPKPYIMIVWSFQTQIRNRKCDPWCKTIIFTDWFEINL